MHPPVVSENLVHVVGVGVDCPHDLHASKLGAGFLINVLPLTAAAAADDTTITIRGWTIRKHGYARRRRGQLLCGRESEPDGVHNIVGNPTRQRWDAPYCNTYSYVVGVVFADCSSVHVHIPLEQTRKGTTRATAT